MSYTAIRGQKVMERISNLTADLMKKALQRLSELIESKLAAPVQLIMGGGGAMILAHGFQLGTTDIDAIPAKGVEIAQLDPLVKQIAQEQNLLGDWLNPYFSTFAHTLPTDYSKRLISVFSTKSLEVSALGPEEMLIMKCFARRQKDIPHAKALIKKGADIGFVERKHDRDGEKGVHKIEKGGREHGIALIAE
jgi:hypothetical protein